LRLRHHVAADFEPLIQLLGSDRARFMDGPYSRQASWSMIMCEAGSWDILGYGSWGIETKDGVFLGQVGINKPPNFPELELGWVLLDSAEGQGFAREAAQAALNWAWEQEHETLVSYIDRQNDRSIALAQRLGALEDPNAPLPDGETSEDTVVYRHAADTDGSPEAYA
jgi:RimJ/RimL family protein N-acetyltransferase